MDGTKAKRHGEAENVGLSSDGKKVVIIDQTELPARKVLLELETPGEMYDAIRDLKVRGAPAIGICAACCMYCLARQIETEDMDTFMRELKAYGDYLNSSRPTAVNLSWAIQRMLKTARAHRQKGRSKVLAVLGRECRNIQEEDIAMCRAISEYGLTLIREGDGILTHCNAGPLATSCYGTALGPLMLGAERGMKFKVYAGETRPLLQGARLTSYELLQAGIDVTLICDNMAATVMKKGWVQACFVGCDRVAANGDTANKIGTNGVAVLAKYYGIPFYVLGPSSTIDTDCHTGDEIEIELRDEEEIKKKYYKHPMAPEGVKCYNPAFDVTDHSLITGIVTEKGILKPPYEETIRKLFEQEEIRR